MTDRLGYRLKLGIVVPSTNSIVQPETDAMRPRGVTNHIGRIHIPDLPLTNDTEFAQIMTAIEPDLLGAVDRVMSCKPAHVIMAMSIPTFWGGMAGASQLLQRLKARAGVPVSLGSLACAEALRKFPRRQEHRHSDALSAGRRRARRPLLRGERLARDRGPQSQTAKRGVDRARHHRGPGRRTQDIGGAGRRRHRPGRHRPRHDRRRGAKPNTGSAFR